MRKIAILFSLFLPQTLLATDCALALQQHLKSDLSLSYKEFDQTMNSGMRVLSAKGCYKETAELIEAYIKHNNAKQPSLRWHIAQQRAMAGENKKAAQAAKQTLKEKEDFSVHALRWNDYVLATIAFLEGDKKSLIKHRNNVAAATKEHYGNELNLKLLDGLIKHFGRGYAYATSNL